MGKLWSKQVLQCKLVSTWWLQKGRSASPCRPRGLEKDFTLYGRLWLEKAQSVLVCRGYEAEDDWRACSVLTVWGAVYNFYRAAAVQPRYSMRNPSVCQAGEMSQNERIFWSDFYTTWTIDHPSFSTRRTVGGGRPLVPEILGQTDPVPAKMPILKSIFACSASAVSAVTPTKKFQLSLIGVH